MSDKRCEDEYARLWQMYGDLEDERDRLREALEKITKFDDAPRYRVDVNTAYSVAIGAVNIARTALQEAGDDT